MHIIQHFFRAFRWSRSRKPSRLISNLERQQHFNRRIPRKDCRVPLIQRLRRAVLGNSVLGRGTKPFTARSSTEGRVTQGRIYDGAKWNSIAITKKNPPQVNKQK